MKLLCSTTSPYVRKVRMFILICDFGEQIEESFTNPFESDTLKQTNPLGKIPVLIDRGLTLYESGLICEYLDDKLTAKGAASLFHKNKNDYYKVQMLHVVANGIIDAAVATLLEKRRDDAEQSPSQILKWYGIIRRSIETLDTASLPPADKPHIGSIALASALGYLDFRFDEYNWRVWNGELNTWFTELQKLEWFKLTRPQ